MNSQYFSCRWKIVYLQNYNVFDNLIDTLHHLGCEIVTTKDEAKYGHEEFETLPFVIRIPAQTSVDELITKVNQQIQLIDWHPTSDTHYSQGYAFDLRMMNGVGEVNDFIDYLNQAARINVIIEDITASKLINNSYFECEWIVDKSIPGTVIQAVAVARQLNGSLYFLKFDQSAEKLITFKFGLRIPVEVGLSRFINESDTKSTLVNWQAISQKVFYTNSRRLDVFGRAWPAHIIDDTILKLWAQKNEERRSNLDNLNQPKQD